MTIENFDNWILYFAHRAMVSVYVLVVMAIVAEVVFGPTHDHVWWATAP